MNPKNISSKSTKEEVAGFFRAYLNIKENISINFIKEYITGDVLLNLSNEELEKYLGLEINQQKKFNLYLAENRDKFAKNENIKEVISFNSSAEEVKLFFGNYLNFKENYGNINGKNLKIMNEEDMKKIGMKLGQRKRLINFIKYLNSKNIIINDKSSYEDIEKFLIEKIGVSKNTVDILKLNGEALFKLKDSDINNLDIPK